MNIKINKTNGELIMSPETAEDRLLIYHLLNCSDLTEFSDYLKCADEREPVTVDIGATMEQISSYPLSPVHLNKSQLIGFNRGSS